MPSFVERLRKLEANARIHAANNPYSVAPMIAELAAILAELVLAEEAKTGFQVFAPVTEQS